MKKFFTFAAMFALMTSGAMFVSCSDDDDDPKPEEQTTQQQTTDGNTNDGNTNGGNTNGGNNNNVSTDKWASLVNEEEKEYGINDDGLFYYGTHTYNISGDITADALSSASDRTSLYSQVTFTNIPSGYTEFETVYKEYLGKDVNGATAMLVMAMEIYGRNNETGEKCLKLITNSSTASEALRILKDRYSTKESDGDVAQRYIAAALLQGATRTNSYTPDEPYTIKFQGSANAPQNTTIPSYGITYYIYALGDGWDTNQRQCFQFLEEDETLFVCSGFPSFYTQCKTIKGEWQGLK